MSTIPTGKGLHLPPGEGVVGRLVTAASGWAPGGPAEGVIGRLVIAARDGHLRKEQICRKKGKDRNEGEWAGRQLEMPEKPLVPGSPEPFPIPASLWSWS